MSDRSEATLSKLAVIGSSFLEVHDILKPTRPLLVNIDQIRQISPYTCNGLTGTCIEFLDARSSVTIAEPYDVVRKTLNQIFRR